MICLIDLDYRVLASRTVVCSTVAKRANNPFRPAAPPFWGIKYLELVPKNSKGLANAAESSIYFIHQTLPRQGKARQDQVESADNNTIQLSCAETE